MRPRITSAVLSVDKPPGLSSRAVVDRVARYVRPAKAGHGGTLDPLATGVLVVCIGDATRLIEFVQQQPKTYHATFRLGVTSETDDTEGTLLEVPAAPVPTRAAIEAAILPLQGEILQRPPAYSAVKVAGRRSYKLARAGQAVELAPRPITIYRLEVLEYDYPALRVHIECSSGTYVRAIGRDLAAALNTGAVMTDLIRTAIGRFNVNDACPWETLESGAWRDYLQPAGSAVAHLPQTRLDAAGRQEISHGRGVALANDAGETRLAALDEQGNLLAILEQRGTLWFPSPNLAAARD